jgi:HEPN domain-containing protein
MGGVNRRDLQSLARTRLAEAKTLLGAGYPDGAYYLVGYAVECALKACIARSTQRHEFPDKKTVDASYTHSLKELIKVANLEVAHSQEANRDSAFRSNWDVVRLWSEHSRYGRVDQGKAQELVDAVGDRKHGVMAWIKQYW